MRGSNSELLLATDYSNKVVSFFFSPVILSMYNAATAPVRLGLTCAQTKTPFPEFGKDWWRGGQKAAGMAFLRGMYRFEVIDVAQNLAEQAKERFGLGCNLLALKALTTGLCVGAADAIGSGAVEGRMYKAQTSGGKPFPSLMEFYAQNGLRNTILNTYKASGAVAIRQAGFFGGMTTAKAALEESEWLKDLAGNNPFAKKTFITLVSSAVAMAFDVLFHPLTMLHAISHQAHKSLTLSEAIKEVKKSPYQGASRVPAMSFTSAVGTMMVLLLKEEYEKRIKEQNNSDTKSDTKGFIDPQLERYCQTQKTELVSEQAEVAVVPVELNKRPILGIELGREYSHLVGAGGRGHLKNVQVLTPQELASAKPSSLVTHKDEELEKLFPGYTADKSKLKVNERGEVDSTPADAFLTPALVPGSPNHIFVPVDEDDKMGRTGVDDEVKIMVPRVERLPSGDDLRTDGRGAHSNLGSSNSSTDLTNRGSPPHGLTAVRAVVRKSDENAMNSPIR